MANNVGLYTKAVVAAVLAGLNSAVTALGDGHIGVAEGVTIASVTVAALAAVWAVPNTPVKVQKYGKAVTSGIVAALGALLTVVLAGHSLDGTALFNIAIALITGLGLVHIAPNAPISIPVPVASGAETIEDSEEGVDVDDIEEDEGEPEEDEMSEDVEYVEPTEDLPVDEEAAKPE